MNKWQLACILFSFGDVAQRKFLYVKFIEHKYTRILGSIVVSIPACHAGDPGSIPGRGEVFPH
ncbi:hypothetical protein T06_8308 [Trichinella sp. T6]|nr:hypothetical protein T06_8308 [Trichinella sp. T6]